MVHPPSSARERDGVWRQVSAKCGRGPASAPCVDGGISWAMGVGGDEGVVARDGGEGGVKRVTWGGRWCSRSAREGGARWWWIGVA